jgi:hypothetical protein
MLNVALPPILPAETHSAADHTSRFSALRVHAISLIPQSMNTIGVIHQRSAAIQRFHPSIESETFHARSSIFLKS